MERNGVMENFIRYVVALGDSAAAIIERQMQFSLPSKRQEFHQPLSLEEYRRFQNEQSNLNKEVARCLWRCL